MRDLLERVRRALQERYEVKQEIGRGGAATVFLAMDHRHDRAVALKVLHPHFAASTYAERFLREIRLAAGLHHPNVVALHDSGEADGLLYYTMPFVDGESLRQRLRREGQLPVDDAVRIARDVAAALGHAHARGIVHRDIKPENILLAGGRALVTDFGIARALDADHATLTSGGAVVGTPAYVSPEQASGAAAVDPRSDIYSLGCVLFEMLAGVPPFHGPSGQVLLALHQTGTPPELRAYRETVPPSVERTVMRALAKSPADRFASAREFVAALDAPVPPEPPPAGGAWWRRRPARLVGAVLVGVFVYLVMQLRPRLGVAGTDSARLVIAPFNVVSRDSALVVWREGIVDVLSTNLADVGPVSAVPPTVADAYWPDHADATSTAELARQTGARFGVYGTLTALGGDSVRVTAVLLDVRRGGARTLRDFQWETPVARLTTLTDSLSHGILVALDRILPVGAVTGAWLGTHTSGPALNEFVRGEHAWRRSDWGTAIEHYERALAVDSTFAPALHRVAAALGWQGTEVDSVVQQFRRRAAAHNHGLPVRESLLVVIDSLSAAVADTSGPTMLPSTYWRLQRRIFATLKEGARRFPNDPELIDQLGDRRYHYAFGPTAVPAESILANFDRAIALDSGFAPTYLHATELGLMLGGDTAGLRYAQKYLTLNQADISATNELMTARLVQAGGLAPAQLRVDTASRDALIGTRNLIDRWADTAETAIALDRVIAARFPVEAGPAAGCATQRGRLAWRLAYRGRLREAWCALGTRGRREQTLAAEIAFLGAMPADSVAVLFAQWEAAGSPWLTLTHPWYAERHDSAALRRLLAAAERRTRADSPADRQRAAYDAASARAYLALVHGDSAQALRRFAALPDTLCYTCSRLDRIVRARLLAAAGRLDAAHEILSGWPGPDVTPLEGLLALERARVARRLGNTAEAQRASELVRRLWIHADSPWRERANRAQ